MTKVSLSALLIYFAASTVTTSEALATGAGEGEWVMYTEESNGDTYFYDASRVEKTAALRRVWNGIRYKRSVMGASSYLTLLEIDCSERTERVLESTFFTDKDWKKPAMMTNTTEKPKRQIAADSPTERLSEILCD